MRRSRRLGISRPLAASSGRCIVSSAASSSLNSALVGAVLDHALRAVGREHARRPPDASDRELEPERHERAVASAPSVRVAGYFARSSSPASAASSSTRCPVRRLVRRASADPRTSDPRACAARSRDRALPTRARRATRQRRRTRDPRPRPPRPSTRRRAARRRACHPPARAPWPPTAERLAQHRRRLVGDRVVHGRIGMPVRRQVPARVEHAGHRVQRGQLRLGLDLLARSVIGLDRDRLDRRPARRDRSCRSSSTSLLEIPRIRNGSNRAPALGIRAPRRSAPEG